MFRCEYQDTDKDNMNDDIAAHGTIEIIHKVKIMYRNQLLVVIHVNLLHRYR
jgi:L-arabinose isomerase